MVSTRSPSRVTSSEARVAGRGKPRLERLEFLHTKTPVEGCELAPYVVIRTAEGEAKSAEAIELKTSGALSVEYNWNRCAAKYSCARRSCSRPANLQFAPLLKMVHDRTLTDDQHRRALKASFFCTKYCLVASWPKLRVLQHHLSEAAQVSDLTASCDEDVTIARMRAHCVPDRTDGVFRDPLENPFSKSQVAWTRHYAPTEEDVGHILELACKYVFQKSDGTVDVGPPLSIRSNHVQPAPKRPIERCMVNLLSRQTYSVKSKPEHSVRVLSYNILAEIYSSSQTFPDCPSWALAWTYRKRNLIREIEEYDADILCLQEVQADHYENHFVPYFTRKGYQSCYKVKTREAMGRKGKIDGCATIFRANKYVLREKHSTEFNSIAQQRTKSARALNRCLKGNIGLILILDAVDGSGPVVVANTHLFWDPDLSDVKLFQVDVFLQEIELVVQAHQLTVDVPIIIGGDFNSEPLSSVYELLSTGVASMTREDIPIDTFGVLSTCRLRHNLHLQSSYSLLGHEPVYTNYTANFVGVLDYLWFNPEAVMASAVLLVPSEETFHAPEGANRVGIPNEQWSSDHIALVTDFHIRRGHVAPLRSI